MGRVQALARSYFLFHRRSTRAKRGYRNGNRPRKTGTRTPKTRLKVPVARNVASCSLHRPEHNPAGFYRILTLYPSKSSRIRLVHMGARRLSTEYPIQSSLCFCRGSPPIVNTGAELRRAYFQAHSAPSHEATVSNAIVFTPGPRPDGWRSARDR